MYSRNCIETLVGFLSIYQGSALRGTVDKNSMLIEIPVEFTIWRKLGKFSVFRSGVYLDMFECVYADLFSYVLSTFAPWRDKVDKEYDRQFSVEF